MMDMNCTYIAPRLISLCRANLIKGTTELFTLNFWRFLEISEIFDDSRSDLAPNFQYSSEIRSEKLVARLIK